jgi:hypothetical protein
MQASGPASAIAVRKFALVAPLLLAPLATWLALGPQAPDGNFVLLAKLAASPAAGDPSHQIYGFARSPAYALVGWLFELPAAFWLGGLVAHALFYLCVHSLALVGSRAERPSRLSNRWIAAVATLAIFPGAWAARWISEGTTLIPHGAYDSFSFRSLAFVLVGFAYRALATDRLRTALWLTAASCAVHPTIGLLAFALYGGAAAAQAAKRREWITVGHACAAAFVAAAPTLFRFGREVDSPELQQTMSAADWYSRMIKDEADDFSLLYQFVVQPRTTLYYLAVIAVALWLCWRFAPASRSTLSFRLAAAVPLLFVAGAILEYLAAVLVPTPLIRPLVSLSVGYRLLSFTFFPLVVLGAQLLAARLGALAWAPRTVLTLSFAVVALAWSALAVFGIASGRTAVALRYASWAISAPPVAGIDAYLAAIERAGGDAFDHPPLARCDRELVTYPGERSLFAIRAADRRQPRCVADRESLAFLTAEGFEHFVTAVRQGIPPGAGLYVPPYVEYFRDALPEHRIFFQEHHDGNLMRGAPRFAAFWCARMRDLLGFDYEGMPSKFSGLSFTRLRQAYLEIDGARARELRQRYPDFRYLITESAHGLPFEVILAADGFIVFDLDAPSDTALPAS